MAEIKVEKKKPVWPWILLIAIIILGILFYVFAYDDTNDDVDDIEDTNEIEELNDTSSIYFKENNKMSFIPNKELIA
ncbi:hypothetical protein APR41_12960 [Salegentibacter salinarum]|uniref:Uncharacterized protein n=1 Tax=Salegentibacter salinarum TaxID=447422 RepID=A0A2N0U1T5_9FLAO|nr:hypothetical protein [Salegentibacter salinarum]PKD20939.1 hypothetical protein APR41_12960 [Salegentibacter salinarum]SKB80163.1 hypothetical protein SAMN05660903_02644 [Salegentibacter salinarum]